MSARLTILEPNMQAALEAGGFHGYGDFIKTEKGKVVNRSSTTETRRLSLNEAVPAVSFFLKVYRYQHGNRRSPFRRDKCGMEVRNYGILRDLCRVDVPDVVAHGCRRSRGRLLDAFILTRGIPNCMAMPDYFSRRWPDVKSAERDPLRNYLLTETAEMVARMHAADFFHIDLQWRNLVVSDDGGSRPRIFVIDSSRGKLCKWPVHRAYGRLRDLSSLSKEARFHLTHREQIRWLRQYLGIRKLNAEQRAMIRSIQQDRRLKDAGKDTSKRRDFES